MRERPSKEQQRDIVDTESKLNSAVLLLAHTKILCVLCVLCGKK